MICAGIMPLDDAKANRLGWIAAGGDINQSARTAKMSFALSSYAQAMGSS